jgi:hypothetical protein
MRKLLFLLSFAPLCLPAQKSPVPVPVVIEMPVYTADTTRDFVMIEQGYAQARPIPESQTYAWKTRRVSRVDLVFTRYPHDLNAWRSRYQQLLQTRLDALAAADSNLFGRSDITWNYVLQTQCRSEAEARQLFHGFVIYTEEIPATFSPEASPTLHQVEAIVRGRESLEDSTAFSALERNKKKWKNMLVVMDWTGSMYAYGASVVLWHSLNLRQDGILHFVFFNDGDAKSTDKKVKGQTGGIYKARTRDIDTVLLKMEQVMRNGHGGDGPENDVEAILMGITRIKHFEEVVLIADNRSSVRDLSLAHKINRPVRIILCGVDDIHPVHEDYLTLARVTGGSIHTIESDIEDLARVAEGETITIRGQKYRLSGGYFHEL